MAGTVQADALERGPKTPKKMGFATMGTLVYSKKNMQRNKRLCGKVETGKGISN